MKKLALQLLLSLSLFPALASQSLEHGQQHQIASKALNETRQYSVHLPQGYKKHLKQKYPVLYLLHGQYDFLSTMAIVNNLVEDDVMPAMVIVGIRSGGPELKNLNSQQFTTFLHQELITHIEQQYRTANYRILSGHSLAGLFVLNNMLDQPEQFNAYFSFSPALATGENQFTKRVEANKAAWLNLNTQLTLTLASEGPAVAKPYQQLITQLKSAKSVNINWSQQKFPNYSHSTTTFPSLLFALNNLFDDWQPSPAAYLAGLKGMKQHYTNLSRKYGFKIEPPMVKINLMAVRYSVAYDGKYQALIPELVEFALQRNAQSVSYFNDSISWMKNQGYGEAADNLARLVCEQLPEQKHCSGAHK